MSSFTAINASLQQDARSSLSNASTDLTDCHHNKADSVTVASSYLGRGDPGPSRSNNGQAPRTVGSKKTMAVRSRGKRANNAGSSSKSKRAKNGTVLDALAVSKTNVSNDAEASTTTISRQKGTKQPSKAKSVKSKPRGKTALHDGSNDSVQSSQIYAAATSMDAIRMEPQLTSLEAVKQPSQQGGLPREKHSLHRLMEIGTVTFTEPWLNSVASIKSTTKDLDQDISTYSDGKDLFEELMDRDNADVSTSLTLAQTSQTQVATLKTSSPTIPDLGAFTDLIGADDTEDRPASFECASSSNPIHASDEDEMLSAVRKVEEAKARRDPKLNSRLVDPHEDYGGAFLSDSERRLLSELQASSQKTAVKPIIRKPFPKPIQDRSPIFGATNTTLLRTCFRIGEALNAGCHAVRTNQVILLELYARVVSSWREESRSVGASKQNFVFHDLYHARPPHLEGTSTLWSQSPLWELDSSPFMKSTSNGTMCRAIGRMRRDELKWRLEVLSIWEASWEDVQAVAGIYGKRNDDMI